MAIKINGKNLAKRIINWQEVVKVMLNWAEIRPNEVPSNSILCFTANQSNSTVKLTYCSVGDPSSYTTMPHYFEMSDDGVQWEDYNPNRLWEWVTITLSNVWDKVYIRNKSTTPVTFGSSPNGYRFVMSGSIAASWDISYLLCKNGSTTMTWGYFYNLFLGCTSLTSAPKIPFASLPDDCCRSMFSWCTSLVTPPQLPATSLWVRCYRGMFTWCTSLTTAPVLPATSLPSQCCISMFSGCTSLTTAPSLPATSLAHQCYYAMFQQCTSLINPPALPATTLPTWCYYGMFYGCSSLEKIPSINATTIGDQSCRQMFRGCIKIEISETQTWIYENEYRIPVTWTWTDWTNSFRQMFEGTGWTFTGDPTINTTYYTSNTIIS